MKRLWGSLYWQLVPGVLLSYGGVLLLLLLTQGARLQEVTFAGVIPPWQVLSLFAAAWVPLTLVALPVSHYLGMLWLLGRLRRDGELVALAFCGVGPGRWLLLFLPSTLIVSALVWATGAFGLEATHRWMAGQLVQMVRQKVAYGLEPGIFHETIPGVLLYGAQKKGSWLRGVFFHLSASQTTVLARRGRLTTPRGERDIWVELQDGEIQWGPSPQGVFRRLSFARYRFPLSLEATLRRALRRAGLQQGGLSSPRTLLRRWRPLTAALSCLALSLLALALGLSFPLHLPRLRGLALLALTGLLVAHLLLRGGELLALSGHVSPAWGALLPPLLLALLGGLFLFLAPILR